MYSGFRGWGRLADRVNEIAGRLQGRISVQVVDPLTGRVWGWQAGERCPSASVIKLLIAWEAFRQAEAGLLGLEEAVTVRPEAVVGGTGVLGTLTPGIRLSWRDLVALMLVVSDNTATNLTIDRLGFEAINHTARSLGLTQTVLERKMMDFAARAAGKENYMSAADAAHLLAVLVHEAGGASGGAAGSARGFPAGTEPATLGSGAGLSASSVRELLAILEKQQFNHKLPALLPGVRCAHKTGELPGLEHDAGIIYLPVKEANGGAVSDAAAAPERAAPGAPADVPVVAVVFTWGLRANADGVRAIAEVGRAVYEAAVGP